MSNEPDSSESDFVDDIVADHAPIHTSPRSNEFQPWHRVRKEFIRQRQWNELTLRIAKRQWYKELREVDAESDTEINVGIGSVPKRPIRCLVIPGDDLLDVRALWRDTQAEDWNIRYLGFNERDGSNNEGTRIHVANNSVTSLPRVTKDSQVIKDRFEQIIHEKSQARRYLKIYGPYHVVNLDFCGSIFPNRKSKAQEYLDAIHELLIYQFAEQKSPWLLFVTTEVEPSIVDGEKFRDFCKITRDNYDQYPEFREGISKLMPGRAFEDVQDSVLISELSEGHLISLFGVSLGKWLLQLGQSAHPQWTVEMRRSYQYSINKDKGAVMLALAFELRPNIIPPQDRTGISQVTVLPRSFPNEMECALKILESVGAIRDVDAVLKEDSNLREQLTRDKASLLASAGFDREAYLEWAAMQESTEDFC